MGCSIDVEEAMRVAVNIVLDAKERQSLERLSRSRSTPVRLAERSKIVLLAAGGKTNGEIAEELGITRQKAGRWRETLAQCNNIIGHHYKGRDLRIPVRQ